MKFDLKAPCKNCPFRTDIPPFLTVGRAEEVSHALVEQQQTFACHKTLDYDSEGEDDLAEPSHTENTQHCAGALIMLEHMNRPNQMMRIAERLGFYDRTNLKMDSPVCKSDKEFIRQMRKAK